MLLLPFNGDLKEQPSRRRIVMPKNNPITNLVFMHLINIKDTDR